MTVSQRHGNPVLRYFGLETGQKAVETVLWALPYLAIMAAALGGLSFLVNWLWPLPLWVHGLAVGLAVFYMFLFLARMRAAAGEADDGIPGAGDEEP